MRGGLAPRRDRASCAPQLPEAGLRGGAVGAGGHGVLDAEGDGARGLLGGGEGEPVITELDVDPGSLGVHGDDVGEGDEAIAEDTGMHQAVGADGD